jgi:hypothetical protein
MSARIKRNAPHLKLLCKAKPSLVKAMIKGAPPDLIDALCECGLNVLKGNVPVSPAQKKRLGRHKNNLRVLVKKGTSAKRRRQILQKGGILPLLLPIIGPAVAGLMSKIF